MKTNFTFFLLLGALIFIGSCSNNDSINDSLSQQTEKTGAQVLNVAKEFKVLNDSLLSIRNSETRGFWKKAFTYCALVGADVEGAYQIGKIGGGVGSLFGPVGSVAGALIGGLIGGAGASYVVYCSTKSTSIVSPQTVISAYAAVAEENPEFTDSSPEQIDLNLPEDKKELLAIGEKHNLILEKLSNEEFSLTPVVEVLTPLEAEIVKSKEFEDGYYSVLNKLIGDDDTYVENDGSTGNIVMKLYLDIINKYPENLNDVEFVSNKYIELISNSSELSEEEKDRLYSAISVAVFSFEYWQSKGL